jgi:hypothetical protein
MSKFPILLSLTSFLLLFLSSCNKEQTKFTERKDENGVIYQTMLSLPSLALGVFVQTDSDHDGNMDDFLWTRTDLKNPTESLLLYNEIFKENHLSQQIFYGPSNRKLYERMDLNEDGTLDTEIFYNSKALPKVINDIIARVQIDTNKDNKPEFVVFPGNRVEWGWGFDKEKGFTGTLCYSEDAVVLIDSLTTKAFDPDWFKQMDSKCRKLLSSASWYLHPERIHDTRYRAVLQLD